MGLCLDIEMSTASTLRMWDCSGLQRRLIEICKELLAGRSRTELL